MMRYLFKAGVLNSNSCNNVLNSHFLAPGVVQVASLSNLPSKSVQNSRKIDKNSDLDSPRELQGFGPLFNEILGILGTENIAADKNAPYGFLVSKETQLRGNVGSVESSVCQLQSACENAEEKRDHGKTGNLVLENNGTGISDEIEVKDVSPIVHKVTEIVRSKNGLLSMEERLERADLDYNEEVVEKVLKRCFKVPHLALRFFKWVKFNNGFQHTANTFNTMINIAGEAKEFGLIKELAEEMEKNSCEKNIKTWTVLVSYYGKAKLIGKALLMFEEMKTAGVRPDAIAYREMLRVLCNAGKADLALEFYKDMVHNENKNIILDTGIFETLVKGLCSRDRIADAMEILEIMKRRDVFNQNIYGILISTHLRRNEVSEAFNLFQDAKESGIISVSTYTNLMQHLFWKNEFEKGLELYNEMLAMGIQLDSVAITAVAAGCLRQNCVSEAWKVFKSMDEKGIKPTSKSYTIFIKELCKVSDADVIAKVLDEMEACKVNVRDDIFWQVTSYLEKKGDIEKLNKLKQIKRGFTFYPRDGEELGADECNRQELSGESESNQLVQKRLSDSFPESALKLSRIPDMQEVCQILSSSTDWCSIQEKLEELCFQFRPELVVEILRKCSLNISTALKFFSWVGKQTGYSHNEQSYNMAMKIAGQGKNFKQMRSLFYEMRRRGCSITSDAWTIMIMQYGRTGLTDIALRNFREMKLSDCKPTKSTYKFLITTLCGNKGRNVDEAIKIYQEMVQFGCAPDKELVETYVGCLCEVDKLLDARSCIESLHKFGFSIPLSYSLYFRALCRAGKLEDALALMDETGSERNLLNQYTYGSLIHGLLRRGQLEVALAKMKDMKHLGIHPTVHVYTALIIHFLKEKNINKALETLEEMKEGGCQPTIVTYSALISGYVRLGQVTDAWNVFYHLKQNGPSPDFKTYSMFIDCLCRIGLILPNALGGLWHLELSVNEELDAAIVSGIKVIYCASLHLLG
ncbi:UNVERIFIED_CONTAM: putative pentatricopeptide repeat-containing protein, mitochondrial [Sesamum radiatum]|uniref:Pentatricopeptide repeat-containing protein, mitochondrial n=1 Tax=Sesamum radiatum TaxID=300843 RepID=A0AAW2M0C4_SESRA